MGSSFSETNRISLIWRHPLYQKHCEKIQELEKDRIFCRHTPEHFLDVARLMYIYSLENKLNLSREIIYATALLHDIGRAQQYLSGISHDIAGAEIAGKILADLHFTEQEKEEILSAISQHRTDGSDNVLAMLLYKADKKTVVKKGVVDKGQLVFDDLLKGTYYVKETKTKENFNLLNTFLPGK